MFVDVTQCYRFESFSNLISEMLVTNCPCKLYLRGVQTSLLPPWSAYESKYRGYLLDTEKIDPITYIHIFTLVIRCQSMWYSPLPLMLCWSVLRKNDVALMRTYMKQAVVATFCLNIYLCFRVKLIQPELRWHYTTVGLKSLFILNTNIKLLETLLLS